MPGSKNKGSSQCGQILLANITIIEQPGVESMPVINKVNVIRFYCQIYYVPQ